MAAINSSCRFLLNGGDMYATVNDLKNRLPESELAQLLSMHENGEQAAELALADASAQINSY